jgi:hypothetical protein
VRSQVLSLLLLPLLVACSPPPTFQAMGGTRPERVARITRLLSTAAPPPGALLDAHFLEERTGDGRLGPSDFEAYDALILAPADLPAWRAALSRPTPWNHFSNDDDIKRAAPAQPQPWWVSEDDVNSLEFYSPASLTGNANGWVGLAPDGRIFVYSFTI